MQSKKENNSIHLRSVKAIDEQYINSTQCEQKWHHGNEITNENINIIINNYQPLVDSQLPENNNYLKYNLNMGDKKACVKGAMKLSEALDSMSLAYNPITKQLHFVSPKVDKNKVETATASAASSQSDTLSKKGSFSDEGNFSISTCDKSDSLSSGSPKSTLQWSGHQRGKDGGSFSSTISSLSEYSLSGSYVSKDDAADDINGDEKKCNVTQDDSVLEDSSKLKKKGLSGFFSRGVFPWRSSGVEGSSWRLFGRAAPDKAPPEDAPPDAAAHAAGASPGHRRQGSATSEKQFEDLIASSIALIQHDRPSNLPAKCSSEALRHRAEHARVVAAARRRGAREAAARRARQAVLLRLEERAAQHAREWTENVLPCWSERKSSKRTQELWWCGLPPSVRGKVWQLAIKNVLGVTLETYEECVTKAKLKLHEAQLRRKRLKLHSQTANGNSRSECDVANQQLGDTDCLSVESLNMDNSNMQCNYTYVTAKVSDESVDRSVKDEDLSAVSVTRKLSQSVMHRNFSEQNLKSHSIELPPSKKASISNPNLFELSDECSMELIQLDIARTFPHLCIFQPGGPYFDVLHELLAAYVCYRPDIGYVQGMSFLAAVLILNMEAPQAFICFTNLLNGPVLKAAFSRDGATMQRLWNAYAALLRENLPALHGRVAPELYLLEWLYTAFAKAMPLDAACHVWDVFLRDGDQFLFQTALGVLHLYHEELIEMDFIAAAQFLTKLPEDLSSDALFKSISAINMTLDGLSFEELVESCQNGEYILDEDSENIAKL